MDLNKDNIQETENEEVAGSFSFHTDPYSIRPSTEEKNEAKPDSPAVPEPSSPVNTEDNPIPSSSAFIYTTDDITDDRERHEAYLRQQRKKERNSMRLVKCLVFVLCLAVVFVQGVQRIDNTNTLVRSLTTSYQSAR